MTIRTILFASVAGLAAVAAMAQGLQGTVASPLPLYQDRVEGSVTVGEVPAQGSFTVSGCGADGWCKIETDSTIGWVRGDAANVTAGGETFLLSAPPQTVTIATLDANGGAVVAGPDTEVIAYTRKNPLNSITWSGDIALGDEVPETVVLTPVPETVYRYVYVDEIPVIVDGSNRVVAVVR